MLFRSEYIFLASLAFILTCGRSVTAGRGLLQDAPTDMIMCDVAIVGGGPGEHLLASTRQFEKRHRDVAFLRRHQNRELVLAAVQMYICVANSSAHAHRICNTCNCCHKRKYSAAWY